METSVELAGLASAAAARLIDLLTTDGWAAVKNSVLSLWRPAHRERATDDAEERAGGRVEQRVGEELDEARDELLRARRSGDGQELRGLLVAEWQARIVRLLATRPGAVDELRTLLRELPSAGEQRISGPMTLEAHVSGGDSYQAGRDIHVTRGGRA